VRSYAVLVCAFFFSAAALVPPVIAFLHCLFFQCQKLFKMPFLFLYRHDDFLFGQNLLLCLEPSSKFTFSRTDEVRSHVWPMFCARIDIFKLLLDQHTYQSIGSGLGAVLGHTVCPTRILLSPVTFLRRGCHLPRHIPHLIGRNSSQIKFHAQSAIKHSLITVLPQINVEQYENQ